ncbi:MAG: hypothetical protein WEB60_05700 [Terrimicrobiaceae bacterium]
MMRFSTTLLRMACATSLAMATVVAEEMPQEAGPGPADLPLVTGGRDISQFEFLFKRSPFSLPTAEEKSPVADRYVLTGAASWDGKQRIFVFDRTAQTRHVLEPDSEGSGLMLMEFLPDSDPRKMKARVRIQGEIATLAYAEPEPVAGAVQGQQIMPVISGQPAQPVISNPGIPGQQNPPRRVIRRRVISGNPAPPNP